MVSEGLPGGFQTSLATSRKPSCGLRFARSRFEQVAQRPQARIDRPCAVNLGFPGDPGESPGDAVSPFWTPAPLAPVLLLLGSPTN